MTLPRGSTLVMDNLRAHHSKEVRDVLNNKWINILFSPPYSPRCNPIEKVFGILKPMYRKQSSTWGSTRKEAYKECFLDVIEKHINANFQPIFQNTLVFLRETLNCINDDPDFKFNGYDVQTITQLNRTAL